MEAIETQLKGLQKEREEREAEIASMQKTLQDEQKQLGLAKTRRNEVSAKIASLESEARELQTSRSAIAGERKTARSEISDAKETIDEVTAQLGREHLDDLKAVVGGAVHSVDEEINRKKEAVDKAQDELTKAKEALKEAQDKLAFCEKGMMKSKGSLKSRPNEIRTARGQVARLKSAVKSAGENGLTTEVWYFMEKLKNAVDKLEELVDPKGEEDLVKRQTDCQQEADAAKDEIAKKAAACDRLRAELAMAEREYQANAQRRETAIKQKLATLPQEPREDVEDVEG